MKTITINGIDYIVKQTFRSLIIFEEMTGKAASEMNTTIKDMMTLFYSNIKANNIIKFDFDEFLTLLDDEPEALNNFNKMLSDTQEAKGKATKKKRRYSNFD